MNPPLPPFLPLPTQAPSPAPNFGPLPGPNPGTYDCYSTKFQRHGVCDPFMCGDNQIIDPQATADDCALGDSCCIDYSVSNCTKVNDVESYGCKTKGFFCTFNKNFSFAVSASYRGSEVPNTNIYADCDNITTGEYCPKGYYCPNPFEKRVCPSSHFCGVGSSKPISCIWGLIACPYEGMSEKSIAGLVIPFFICTALLLFGFRFILQRSVLASEAKYSNYDSTHPDIHDPDVIEHDQKKRLLQNYKKIFEALKISKTVSDQEAMQIFDAVDADKDGSLDADELTTAMQNAGVSVRRDKVQSIIELVGTCGKLPRDRFLSLFDEIRASESTKNDDHDAQFNDISVPLNVSFTELCLTLNNGSPVLENVAGRVEAFKVTALMGPSGAGKTSLLNLLRGQAHYANVTGNMYVNGKRVSSLNDYRERMAFVPQDDIMNDELTVAENVTYAAMLFNQRGYQSEDECLPFVNYALDILGIAFIRNSVVGSAEKKGISGGQKKRVSVGMEMMKEAALFFLDEPTSGLDSATSMSLLHSLHEVSMKGVTVVATLHQPRQEIFDLFSCLILLAPGGKIAYFGPATDLTLHFSRMRYECPKGCNATDFVMDVLAGFVKPVDSDEVPNVKQIIQTVTSFWVDNGHQYIETAADLTNDDDVSEDILANVFLKHKVESMFWFRFRNTLVTAFFREFKIYERKFMNTISTSASLAILGLIIAVLFGSVAFKTGSSGNPVTPNLAGPVTSSQLAYGMLVMTSALKIFGHDSMVRTREESGGLQFFPMFIGKVVASGFELIFYPFSYLAGYYSFVGSNASYEQYFQTYVLLQSAIMGLSALISVSFSSENSFLVATALLVVLWAFAGLKPSYDDILGMGPLVFLNWISPFRWSIPLQLIQECESYSDAWDPVVQSVYEIIGHGPSDISLMKGMLVVYGSVTAILTYIVLEVTKENGHAFYATLAMTWGYIFSSSEIPRNVTHGIQRSQSDLTTSAKAIVPMKLEPLEDEIQISDVEMQQTSVRAVIQVELK